MRPFIDRPVGIGLVEIGDKRVLQAGSVLGLPQLFRRADRKHLAGVHEGNAVAALGLVHEMRRHEDRHAVAPRQLSKQAPEHVARGGIDPGGRLVENQHLGAMQACGSKLQPLPDAERQARRFADRRLDQVEMLQRPVGDRFTSGSGIR